MREDGARGTIKTPRQARAVIHVKHLGHGGHLYTPSPYRKGDKGKGLLLRGAKTGVVGRELGVHSDWNIPPAIGRLQLL